MATSKSSKSIDSSQPNYFCVPIKLSFLVQTANEVPRAISESDTKAVFEYLDLVFKDIADFFRKQFGCDAVNVQADCIVCCISSKSSFQKFYSQYKTYSLESEFSTFVQKMEIADYMKYKNVKIITRLDVDDAHLVKGKMHFSSAEVAQSSVTSDVLASSINTSSPGPSKVPGFSTGVISNLYVYSVSGVAPSVSICGTAVTSPVTTVTGVSGIAPSVSSYGTTVTSPSSGDHSGLAEENFQTNFQLFTHDYENVKKVVIIFKSNKNFPPCELVKSTVQPHLWCKNNIDVQQGLKYVYRISYVSIGRFYNSDHNPEEERDRCVTQSAYHRDIFSAGKKPLTETQILSGWKTFVLIMLQSISNKTDLDLMLKEYSNRDIRDLMIFSRRELADHVVQNFYETSNNGNFSVERAVFVLYVLSTLLTSFEDWRNCKMKQHESKSLLSALQSIVLENHLPDHMRNEVISTLTRLVKHSLASATWLNYVYHCFPVLTGEELLQNVKSFREDYSDTKLCADVVRHVWMNREARQTGFTSLLAHVFRNATLGRELLYVYKQILIDKYENVQPISYGMRDKIVNVIKDCDGVKHFRTVLRWATDVCDADLLSYLELTEVFEKAVFNSVSKAGFSDEEASSLLSFACKSPLFIDQQARGLLEASSQSKSLAILKLFSTLMTEMKFYSSVSNDDLLRLINNWLDAFGKMLSSGMNLKLQHEYLWQLVTLPVVEKEEALKKQVDEKVRECYHGIVRKTVKCAALRDIEEIVLSCSDLMVELRPDVVDCVITCTKKTADWPNDNVEIFKRLVLSQDHAIFLDGNDIVKLLEALASSKAFVIFSLFFCTLNNYFRNLRAKEIESVVDKWIGMAKELFYQKAIFDCRSRSSKPKLVYLTQLYEFSHEALSGSCLMENEDISCKLTTFIKLECKSNSSLHDELLELCDANKSSGGLTLLERHLCEIQQESCPSPEEVFASLQKRLQLKRDRPSTNVNALNIPLDHLHVHMLASDDGLPKAFFFLNNCQIASMIYQEPSIKQHKAVVAMHDVMKEFVDKIKKRMITVNEFEEVERCFQRKEHKEKSDFIQIFYSTNFNKAWKDLDDVITNARKTLKQVTLLFEVLLNNYTAVAICDKEDIRNKLSIKRLQVGLTEASDAKNHNSQHGQSGSCVLLELSKSSFYGCLEDLLPCARTLEKYCDLETFVSFCHTTVTRNTFESHFNSPSNEPQDLEASCAKLFGDEEQSACRVTMAGLALIFVDVCMKEYKKWLEGITDITTLDYVMRYCSSETIVHDEVKKATRVLRVELSDVVWSSLSWFSGLRSHKNKVKHVEKLIYVYDFAIIGNSMDADAFKTFHNCLASLKDVTVQQLADAMASLEQILSVSSKEYWGVVEELSLGGELIKFLRSSIDDDFRFLIDAVEERTEQTIDESTVSDLIRVKQFLQSSLRQKFDGPSQLLDSLRKSLDGMGDEGHKMEQRISSCRNHIHSLRALYQHVADRGELTKEIIVNAMTRATYRWVLESHDSRCQLQLSYEVKKQEKRDSAVLRKKVRKGHGYQSKKPEKKDKFIMKTEELNDLRSRALLISSSDKQDKEVPGKNKSVTSHMLDFVEVVDVAQNIAQTVTTLRCLGHFTYQKYSRTISCSKQLLTELKNILTGLQSELGDWENILRENRKLYRCLNFIYSDQLSLVNSYLRNSQDKDHVYSEDHVHSDSVTHLLQFIHPGLIKEHLIECQPSSPVNTNCIQAKLREIGETLDRATDNVQVNRKCFPTNHEFIQQALDFNAVVESGQLFIAHLESNSTQTIPVLLSLYFNTMRQFPVPSEVLFCHDNTSWEELHLILQRCARSSSLFCIANIESLPNNSQYQLVEQLCSLLNSEHSYRMAIICRGGTHHPIIDHFSSFVHQLQGFDDATLKVCLQSTWPGVVMVTSAVPGLGKTELIRQLASDARKSVRSVHISGPITRESLVDRLKQCSVKTNDVLHVDIAEVSDISFLDSCLFELLVLGCMCSGTRVACLPTSTVAIEVANTVRNHLRDSLVVTSSFKREHLKWKNYQDYIVSMEVYSPVQIVCRYLQQLELGRLDLIDVKLFGSEALSVNECRKLLATHFSASSDTSFAMVEIFLNVFAGQLRQLSNSQFFTVKNLTAMLGNTKPIDVRSQLVKALMDVAKEFSLRSVQSCRAVQTSARNVETFGQIVTVAEELVQRVEGMIQWEDSNHVIVAFHGSSSQTVSVLYRDVKLVPEHVKALFKSQTNKELDDFKTLSHQALCDILCRLIKTSQVPTTNSASSKPQYALTPDNLVKMVLILLRIRANVPVVIMGETGCGKTSLIRFLASLCQIKSEHFGIHAGTTEEDLRDVVTKSNEVCKVSPNKQLWLFLDEINTCNHIGLITELVCHNSCFGKALCRNLILIAACNPYKLREQHQIATAGLLGKVKNDEYSRLVYRVHPLSETMIDYVWDYGSLNASDEQKYIREMVSLLFPNSHPSWKLQENIVSLLVASQDITREIEGNRWCVSLRDVNRCRLLMDYFYDMLHEKSKFSNNGHSYEEKDFYMHAIVLAVAHCYVSRFATTKHRQAYWKCCANILLKDAYKYDTLVEIVRNEQLDLLNRMEIPEGIAKNTALRENVFTILVCILNRIPVFLVGKPGCSKSLSLQLIKSNLRGKDSVDDYFQTLPNLYVVSYQGSESSTSEGIEKVFAKAEKYRKANQQDNVLPVVLLDEVGLAEASKFNPLKVLHSLLEPNTGELPQVAVVGISNWALDAAKMNRAIHISRPDMDEDELYDTGIAISTVQHEEQVFELGTGSSCRSECVVPKPTLKDLAKAYFNYQTRQKVKNFHGLRDYYSLIKYVSRHMSKSHFEEKGKTEIFEKGLRRNFGGLVYELPAIIQHFSSVVQASNCLNWRVEDIIEDNMKDTVARHLMVITKGDSALGILLSSMSTLQRQTVVIIGSKFEEDQTEDYSYRILNRIILCMEAGNTLILKDLDSIYGSLYDMLNQNYTVVGKKKNCRIALGPYSNPMCQVHDDFRCVVLVEEQRVDYSDPPFLNRFEKQVLRFEDLIQTNQRQMIDEVNDWMQMLSNVSGLSFTAEHAFLGLNTDTVPSFVYQMCNLNGLQLKDIFRSVVDECKDAVMWLVLPDAMLRTSQSNLAEKGRTDTEALCLKYFKQPVHKGLSHIFSVILNQQLETLPTFADKSQGCRLVIYTHSVIHVSLNSILAEFQPICVEKLGAFKSEKQLTKQLRKFFESDAKILILQCRPTEDWQHTSLAKFQLEELQQEYWKKSQAEKHICLIFHMERCSDMSRSSSSWQFSYLSGWSLMTVDSLEDPGNFDLSNILDQTACEMLATDFQPIRKCILERLLWSFTCTSSSYGERTTEELLKVIKNISSSSRLLECLSKYILEKLRLSEMFEEVSGNDLTICKRWIVNVASDMLLLRSATSFVDALRQYLVQLVSVPLAKIIYKLESLSAWHSYFMNDEQQTLWETCFRDEIIFSIDSIELVPRLDSFKINHKPLNLRFPFSMHFIHKLCTHYEWFTSDLLTLEREEDNMDEIDDSELKASVYSDLFAKYRELFAKDLSQLFDLCNFEQQCSDFIVDLCNYLALDHMSNEEDRINVALWFIGYRSYVHADEDALTKVTESLLCLWRYEELFRNVLRLIAECRHILPSSIEDMLDNIGHGTLHKQQVGDTFATALGDMLHDELGQGQGDSLHCAHESAQTQGGMLHGEFALGQGDSLHHAFHQTEGGSVHEVTDFESPLAMHEKYIDGDSQIDPPSNYDESNDLQLQPNLMEDTEINSSDIDVTVTANDKRYLEEKLICQLCEVLMPSETLFTNCGGIDGWQLRVCSVLSFCGLVSDFPKLPYVLRVFNDLATVLLSSNADTKQIEGVLVELAHHCYLGGKQFVENVSDMFDGVVDILNRLRAANVPATNIQHFFTLYVGRCMDTSSDTEVVFNFLNQMAHKALPEHTLAYCEPVVRRIFLANDQHLAKVAEWIRDETKLDYESCTYFLELDEALKQCGSVSDCDLLVLCVDVIGRVVMASSVFDEDHAWQSLAVVESAEDIRLVTFKAAIDVLQHQQTVCLRLAFAAAYVRAFLQQLACIIGEDYEQNSFSSHRLLYQHVDAGISGITTHCTLEYLIKELKSHGQTLTHVAKQWRQAQELMTSLSNIEWPEDNAALSLGYRIVGHASGVETESQLEHDLRHLGSDDKPINSYIAARLKTSEGVTSLIEAVSNIVYLQTTSRPLKDSEKQIGDWFSSNVTIFDSPLDKLILRLSSKQSFGVDMMQLTSESGLLQLQQACFSVHLMSAVIAGKSAEPFDLLFKFMCEPQCLLYNEINLAIHKLNKSLLETFANKSEEAFINCRCWSRLCATEIMCNQCPLCTWKWPRKDAAEQMVATKGDEDNSTEMHRGRFVALNIIKILFDSSVLNGVALGLLANADLAQLYQCTNENTQQQCFKMASEAFQESWKVLVNYLPLTSEGVALLLHRVVDMWNAIGCKLCCVSHEELPEAVRQTCENVLKMVLGHGMYVDLKRYLGEVCAPVHVVESTYEITKEGEGEGQVSAGGLRALFRRTSERTMRDLESKYSLSHAGAEHPVIGLFFDMEPALSLVKHLSPILKWVRLCNELASHRLSREECKTTTIGKLIHNQSEKQSENFRSCFDCFLKSWEELRTKDCFSTLSLFDESLKDVLNDDGILPQVHVNTAVQCLIVDGAHALLYRILKVLAKIQNIFLDQLLLIASDKKCPAISFLRKVCLAGGAATSVRCVLLQNVKTDQIIEFDLPQLAEELSVFAQNNLNYGLGTCIIYDFVKIEMELSNQLALGKTHLVLDGSFPFASYANEMFVTCSSFLLEFAAHVPQKPIGTAIKSSIDSRRKENAEYVQQTMRQTEILLCIAKRTGGSANQTLASFVQQWLVNLPGGFAADLFPSSGEPLRLCHVVDLYELLEDMHADVVIDTIPDCYRWILTDQVRADIKHFVDKNLVKVESLRTALRRFVMRYVVSMTVKQTNPDEPLVTWLKEPTLWPEGVNDQGMLTSSSQPRVLKDEFPHLLVLKYVYYAVKLVDELLQMQRQGKFLPTPKPSSSTATVAAKQPPRGSRATKTLKLGRT